MTRQDTGRLLEQANAALDSGNSKKALGLFDRVLEVSPSLIEAHAGRARALNRQGRAVEAITLLERLEQMPESEGDWLVRLARGEIAAKRGEWAHAEQEFRSVLEKLPSTVWAILGTSDALCELGSSQAAEAMVRDALASRPRESLLWGALATSLRYQGRHLDALKESLPGLRIAPSRITWALFVETIIGILRLPILAVIGLCAVCTVALPRGWYTVPLVVLWAALWLFLVVLPGLLRRNWGRVVVGIVLLPLTALSLFR